MEGALVVLSIDNSIVTKHWQPCIHGPSSASGQAQATCTFVSRELDPALHVWNTYKKFKHMSKAEATECIHEMHRVALNPKENEMHLGHEVPLLKTGGHVEVVSQQSSNIFCPSLVLDTVSSERAGPQHCADDSEATWR